MCRGVSKFSNQQNKAAEKKRLENKKNIELLQLLMIINTFHNRQANTVDHIKWLSENIHSFS